MNKEQLTALVAEILGQMEPQVKASDYHPTEPQAQKKYPPILRLSAGRLRDSGQI